MKNLIQLSITLPRINFLSIFIFDKLLVIHNECIATVIQAIKATKRVGADCIKLQTFNGVTIMLDFKKSNFKTSQGTLWERQYLHDLYLEKPLTNKNYIWLSRVSAILF